MAGVLQRAIPLGKAAAKADSREAMISARMGKTVRLDILPNADEMRTAVAVQAGPSKGVAAALSAEELRSFFQNAYDAAVITSLEGKILFDNIRAREFLFSDGGGFPGKSIISFISGADDETLQTIRETLESERFIRISAWCHGSSGEYFPADIAVHRFASGESAHLCFFIRDITDRLRAEEAERNVERNRVMMESIGTVCHHLGQPSTVILSGLELLKNGGPSSAAERDELISMALDAAEKIGELLKELNELSNYRSEAYTAEDSIIAIADEGEPGAE